MTLFTLVFVALAGKVEWLSLIWGIYIYARFSEKNADSSQHILSLIIFKPKSIVLRI